MAVKKRRRPTGAKPEANVKKSGNYIAAWRKFRGIDSQGKLAELSGITRATINRLESGKLPYRQWLLEKLATALRCAPHDLIGTDPYGVPDILALYLRIPASKRAAAKTALRALIDG